MLSVLFVLLLIIIIIFSYLFFAPFYLEINSTIGLYRVRFHHLASAILKIENESLFIETKIMWWKKKIDLFQIKYKVREKPVRKPVKRLKMKISINKIKRILASFKVNKLYLSIDSGDNQLNGLLFPLFYWMSIYTSKSLKINFIDNNIFILEIENSFARMSWAYISS